MTTHSITCGKEIVFKRLIDSAGPDLTETTATLPNEPIQADCLKRILHQLKEGTLGDSVPDGFRVSLTHEGTRKGVSITYIDIGEDSWCLEFEYDPYFVDLLIAGLKYQAHKT